MMPKATEAKMNTRVATFCMISVYNKRKNRPFLDGLFLAQLPLTGWNRIKAELIEMWEIVSVAQQVSPLGAKGL